MFKFVVVLAIAALAFGELISFCVIFSFFSRTKQNLPRLDGRIVGGEDAEIEEYPYQVSVWYSGRHICGGSVIGNKHIVTAAGCTYGFSASMLSIRAGSSILNTGSVVVKVAKIHQHPKYDDINLDYDVSVLELENELSYGPTVAKINLPTQNQSIPAGTNSVVSGWGALQEGGSGSQQLQVVKVPIFDHKKCQEAYKHFNPVTDRMLCAGVSEGGKDACLGDAGGPLVANGNLVGIVSWGYGCARPNYPGVYTSVPSIRDYIKEVSGI